jgi:hypothetical protein
MKLRGAKERAIRCHLFWVLFLATSTMLTGCGGSSAPPAGLPGQPPAAEVNSYVGQPGDSSENALWNVTINRSENTYSYGPTTAGSTPTSGSIAIVNNNFVILLGPNGYQSGLAVEVPGQAIILRPGDSTAPLVFAVQQPSCFAIGDNGNVKFLYALSPGINGPSSPFFGQIYAATSPDGSGWQFNNQINYISPYQFAGQPNSVPPAAEFPGYPGDFSATCAAADEAATVSATPLAYFNSGANTFPVPTQFVINPGGLFFENQNYTNVPATEAWDYPNVAAWGVSESTLPITVGGVATANYVGFLFESDPSDATYRTRLVGFGNAPISGTVMNGGTFPNEDPTQQPDINMSLTFGSQDPLNNGQYYLAKLTIPNDASSTFTGSCLSYGVSQTGISTCTNDGVTIVGGSTGMYTIIMSASDTSGNQTTLVLFEQ